MAKRVIDIVPPNFPEDEVLTVYMSPDQYEHLLYCADRIDKNRENARIAYYERKAREGKQPRKKYNAIQGSQAYQQYMQQQLPDVYTQQQPKRELYGGGGGYKPLRLVVQNPYL